MSGSCGPLIDRTLARHGAPNLLRPPFYNGEPQTGPTGSRGKKRLEDLVLFVRRNARPLILHGEFDVLRFPLWRRQTNPNGAAFPACFQGVDEEI